jgi:metal-responsive CopG/Arc/MetJ family transcriptional regulator
MNKRIQVILPETTVSVLDRVTTKGNRSRFIDRAVRHLVAVEGKANLRQRLKDEALANAERDLAAAAEWFPLEEEATQLSLTGRPRKPTRKRA